MGCIPDERVCNGFLDCLDQTDEFQCNDLRRCNGDQFQCDNGECIPQSYKCDNFNDCDRGEDERVCAVTQFVPVNTRRPSPPEININTKCDFQCWDGMCQPWEARCNGANDCLKGEDEMKCRNSNAAGQQPSPIRRTQQHGGIGQSCTNPTGFPVCYGRAHVWQRRLSACCQEMQLRLRLLFESGPCAGRNLPGLVR